MTKVNLDAMYGAAQQLRQTGVDGGAALTHALNAIGHDAVAAACGDDEPGLGIFQGFSERAAGLIDAGAALEESLTNIADGIAAATNLLQQTDGQNAEAIRAADLGLQTNGEPLPVAAPTPDTPDRGR